MSWCKLISHDMRCGMLRLRYLIVPLLAFIPCLEFLYKISVTDHAGSWMDFILNTFIGVPPVVQTSSIQEIKIPFLWLLMLGACLITNLDYMLYDLTNNGQQVIIRSGTKTGWFLSKCVWNLTSTVCYFIMIALVEALFVLVIGGKLSTEYTVELSELLFKAEAVELTVWESLLIGCITPCLAVAALSILEMVLCLVVKPIISFLVCMTLLVLSVYHNSPFDLGNGAMCIRSTFVSFGGHEAAVIIGFALTVIVGCIIGGAVIFKYSDILTEEN